MGYIDPQIVAKAKQMDLLTYLQNYEPQELQHISGEHYCTKEHDSLVISHGKWCWYSHGIGGTTALNYLIKVKEYSFEEAVKVIMGYSVANPPVIAPHKESQPKAFALPKRAKNFNAAINYLMRRGIDRDITTYCIENGLIYESEPYHNVVFVGFDTKGSPRYAALRGIGTDFKIDATGSDKKYSFSMPANRQNSTVHLFECAIDLLSYATLCKLHNISWRQANLLSLAGIYAPRKAIEESKIPAALMRFLEDYPDVKSITLHLDNDEAGRLAVKAITAALPKEYNIINKPPKLGKDYNEYLCQFIKARAERSLER